MTTDLIENVRITFARLRESPDALTMQVHGRALEELFAWIEPQDRGELTKENVEGALREIGL